MLKKALTERLLSLAAAHTVHWYTIKMATLDSWLKQKGSANSQEQQQEHGEIISQKVKKVNLVPSVTAERGKTN